MKSGRPSITARLDIARMLRKNKVWLWGSPQPEKVRRDPRDPTKIFWGVICRASTNTLKR
jgi:hypothetical protein